MHKIWSVMHVWLKIREIFAIFGWKFSIYDATLSISEMIPWAFPFITFLRSSFRMNGACICTFPSVFSCVETNDFMRSVFIMNGIQTFHISFFLSLYCLYPISYVFERIFVAQTTEITEFLHNFQSVVHFRSWTSTVELCYMIECILFAIINFQLNDAWFLHSIRERLSVAHKQQLNHRIGINHEKIHRIARERKTWEMRCCKVVRMFLYNVVRFNVSMWCSLWNVCSQHDSLKHRTQNELFEMKSVIETHVITW